MSSFLAALADHALFVCVGLFATTTRAGTASAAKIGRAHV